MKKNYDFSNAVKNPYAEQLKDKGVNLFWETRKLTQAREDHLTSFIAAALEVDYSFRHGYESSASTPEEQEEKLFSQIAPILDALLALKGGASADTSLNVRTANGEY